MRFPLTLLKSLLIWAWIALLPGIVALIFFRGQGAILVVVLVGVALLISAMRAQRLLHKGLGASTIQIGRHRVFAIEDPSSHAFATRALFTREPSLWITRGALSLLTPDEIGNLIEGMRRAALLGGLGFETVLTHWLILLVNKVPQGMLEILFFRQKTPKRLLIRESAVGVFWISWILLLETLYFRRPNGKSFITEEVLRKLEAESRRCVPRLPVALSSHSAVSPWPEAFLTLGRPCLLPTTAVNLEA